MTAAEKEMLDVFIGSPTAERRLVPITQKDIDAGWKPGLDDPGVPGMRLETDAEFIKRLMPTNKA